MVGVQPSFSSFQTLFQERKGMDRVSDRQAGFGRMGITITVIIAAVIAGSSASLMLRSEGESTSMARNRAEAAQEKI